MESIKLKAKLMWPFLSRVNEMSNAYQVDLTHLSPKAVEALEKMGIEVRSADGKGNFITCKSQRPIFAFDDGGSQIEGEIVGNGSEAVCVVSSYKWAFKNKKGVSPSLKRLVITDLVAYSGGSSADVSPEDDDLL